jgi:NADH-quinone oxidoreductase subunit G
VDFRQDPFHLGRLRTQRLDRPYVRHNGALKPATWPEALPPSEAVSKAGSDKIGAIAGDLATVEEMYALKLLMASLGSQNIDCRQDGAALDPSLGRASYIFNPTIEGIEHADAVLIIGANPRFEASVLNARLRKRSRQAGDFPIGVIGEVGDSRYLTNIWAPAPKRSRNWLRAASSSSTN